MSKKSKPAFDPEVLDKTVPNPVQDLETQQLITKLIEKRDEYVERLDVGAAKIDEAEIAGKDVSTWKDYWIDLLHQYQAVCDKLKDLQNVTNS